MEGTPLNSFFEGSTTATLKSDQRSTEKENKWIERRKRGKERKRETDREGGRDKGSKEGRKKTIDQYTSV